MISVLLPTYARPEFLAESIQCFLRQTYTDSELVILNDWRGHTISFEHPRVRVFNNPGRTRHTLGQVRNWLCDHARGDIVTDWDDDDIYLPNHLESVMSMMPLYRGGKCCKQRWQWKWNMRHGNKFRITPAGYMHTVLMTKDLRQLLGGYDDRTRHSDATFIHRILMAKHLIGPGKYIHKPTFIQRHGTGREHVSAMPENQETDEQRHARIDQEAESLGVTGNIVIEPRWNNDYERMSEDSYAAVLKTGWGS